MPTRGLGHCVFQSAYLAYMGVSPMCQEHYWQNSLPWDKQILSIPQLQGGALPNALNASEML